MECINYLLIATWVHQESFPKTLLTHIVTEIYNNVGDGLPSLMYQVPEAEDGLNTEPIRSQAHEAPALFTPSVPRLLILCQSRLEALFIPLLLCQLSVRVLNLSMSQ